MKKLQWPTIWLAASLLLAIGTAGTAWDLAQPSAIKIGHRRTDIYLALGNVIVMLPRSSNDDTTHYLSTDLVLVTSPAQEKQAKAHLPLLRSIAIKSLSANSMDQAAGMSAEQFSGQMKQAFDAAYAAQGQREPFSAVVIGKLIIE